MADIRITHEDGTVEEYQDVSVQLPDSFITIQDETQVIAIHERHIRRASLTGVQPPADR